MSEPVYVEPTEAERLRATLDFFLEHACKEYPPWSLQYVIRARQIGRIFRDFFKLPISY